MHNHIRHPTAEADEVPAGADPRRQYTDLEFDEEDEPEPPDPAERGDIA